MYIWLGHSFSLLPETWLDCRRLLLGEMQRLGSFLHAVHDFFSDRKGIHRRFSDEKWYIEDASLGHTINLWSLALAVVLMLGSLGVEQRVAIFSGSLTVC